MPADQIPQIAAMALIFVVHLLGGLALVWALLDERQRAGWKRGWGWGRGPEKPPPSPPPVDVGGPPVPLPLPLPLPGAVASPVRLRTARRVSEVHPRPARRPEHPPQPAREPQRTPT